MTRARLAFLAAVTFLGTMFQGMSPAAASTHSPCTRHSAAAPYVDVVPGDGTSVLRGAGDVGGCPPVTGTVAETVTIAVCLQREVDGTWTDQSCEGPATRGWNRYSRYARQLGMSVSATCVPGVWRTAVRGGDGWAPMEWASPAVAFAPLDSGVCGATGGGD